LQSSINAYPNKTNEKAESIARNVRAFRFLLKEYLPLNFLATSFAEPCSAKLMCCSAPPVLVAKNDGKLFRHLLIADYDILSLFLF
jgi:hypothetical protein